MITKIRNLRPLLAIALLFVLSQSEAQPLKLDLPFEPPVTRDQLFAPRAEVTMKLASASGGLIAHEKGQGRWQIIGRLTGKSGAVRFKPPGTAWDFSAYSLFSLELTNDGPGIVWVLGRLDNHGAQDWANSTASQAYLMPGETRVLTFAYPRPWELDDSPEAFEPASSKPNGWRSHWKKFNARNVVSCRLIIRSSHPDIKLSTVRPYLAWPYGKGPNQNTIKLPFLDRYGQAIPFGWSGKISSDQQMKDQRIAEDIRLRADEGPKAFNQYGGYAQGPRLKATGYFRTQKVDGRWWLVDPEGRLFWSQGVCTVANRAIVPLSPERRKLFTYVPEQGTPQRAAAFVPYKPYGEWGRAVDFLRLNTLRKYGDNWEDTARDVTHRRLRAWGFNTLGAWSDTELQNDRRTPYTEILHIWAGMHAFDHTADPFEEAFAERVQQAVAKLAQTRQDDPWMIGVFIDNEIVWHNNMVQRVIKAGPKQPAYGALIAQLKQKYKTLDALNQAWGTQAKSWDKLELGKRGSWAKDRDAFYAAMADRYYRICKSTVDRLLPNHLYLGSRVHTCPPIVARQIAKHVDVFSVNHYAPVAGTAQLPRDADLPVMVTEYHFGTADRGVMGMSLSPVHGQVQRSRCFGAYVTAGLMHPNIVGAHWFAYSDQSSAGRPNENYQIGLIDVTDQPYAEMTQVSRAIAERMYPLRLQKKSDLLKELDPIFQASSD